MEKEKSNSHKSRHQKSSWLLWTHTHRQCPAM